MKTKTKTKCDCGHIAESNGLSTGYGYNSKGDKLCFACCGEEDKKCLIEHGKLSGYLVKENGNMYFTNWPGTFRIQVYSTRKSWHNFAGKDGRTDFWVMFEGSYYHGVQIGHNSQCATIRRVKN